MKQKRPRALTNEAQQANVRPGFMGCWGRGAVNICGNYTEEKSLHSSLSCLFHTSLAAGLPNASFRPMSVKGPISRPGHRLSILSPWPASPLPLIRGDRQAFVCLEPTKPGCDFELESDLSWAPAPVRKTNKLRVFFPLWT